MMKLEKRVIKGEYPELPNYIPETFTSLIKNMLRLNPMDRSPAQSIVEDNPWKKIYNESLPAPDEYKILWNKIAKKNNRKDADYLPWEEFTSSFWKLLAVKIDPDTSNEAHCLKNLLCDEVGRVKIERYEHIIRNFGFLNTKLNDQTKHYFSLMVKLCQKPWFYGIMSRTKTEEILTHLYRIKNVKKPVVVRLSEKNGYQFCFCYIVSMAKNPMIQCKLIPPDQYEDDHFYSYLKKLVKGYHYKNSGLKTENMFNFIQKEYTEKVEDSPLDILQAITSSQLIKELTSPSLVES